MKTLLTFFSTLTLVLLFQTSSAQIYIDADEDVGVGQLNTENARLRLVNSDNSKGMYLTQSYSGVGKSWGIQNTVTDVGTNEKVGLLNTTIQNTSSASPTVGFENWTHPYGSGNSYGIQNWLPAAGTGVKYGYYGFYTQNAASINQLFAQVEYVRNLGDGPSYGQYLYFYPNGNGFKEGFYNLMQQPVTSSNYARGVYNYISNSGSGASYGLESMITSNGIGAKYSIKSTVHENPKLRLALLMAFIISLFYTVSNEVMASFNRVYDAAGSSHVKYGFFNYVEDKSTSSFNKFGIYNFLEKSGSGTNYALWSEVQKWWRLCWLL